MKQIASAAAAAYIVFMFVMFGAGSVASGYRDYFTQEQKVQLGTIQTVLVEAVVLTDKGGRQRRRNQGARDASHGRIGLCRNS